MAEFRIVTRGSGYGHVQAQHVAQGGQEVIDEWLACRQRVARFASSQLVGCQVGYTRKENRQQVHCPRTFVVGKQNTAESSLGQCRSFHGIAALQAEQAGLPVTKVEGTKRHRLNTQGV